MPNNKELEETMSEVEQQTMERIRECIYNLLAEENAGLQRFYILWSILSKQERNNFDVNICYRLPPDRLRLYQQIIAAFEQWDEVQNREGAPGCEPLIRVAGIDSSLINEVRMLLLSIEKFFIKYLNLLQSEDILSRH